MNVSNVVMKSLHVPLVSKNKRSHSGKKPHEHKQSDKTLRSDSSLPLDQFIKWLIYIYIYIKQPFSI